MRIQSSGVMPLKCRSRSAVAALAFVSTPSVSHADYIQPHIGPLHRWVWHPAVWYGGRDPGLGPTSTSS